MRGMSLVLVIEDDASTAQEIMVELTSHGFTVELAIDGEDGLRRASTGVYDAITLDRMLPKLDGLALVRALREREVRTPVLMISALSDVDERIAGLRAGGDDYMTKPFASDEMSARVAALVRRAAAGPETTTVIRAGDVELDLVRRTVKIAGRPVKFLNMEFRLLEFLMRNPGQVLSRRLIFERVWEYYFDPGPNLINVHIARLRKKLDRPGAATMIQTVKGAGYRFDAPE